MILPLATLAVEHGHVRWQSGRLADGGDEHSQRGHHRVDESWGRISALKCVFANCVQWWPRYVNMFE